MTEANGWAITPPVDYLPSTITALSRLGVAGAEKGLEVLAI